MMCRHFTFYIWKNFFGRYPRGRLLLAPAYIVCTAAIIAKLRQKQTDLWVLGWVACSVITLVPAWLVEFR